MNIMDTDTSFSRQGFIEELQTALIASDFSLFGSSVSTGYRREYHAKQFKKKMLNSYYSYEYFDMKSNMVLFPEHSGRLEVAGDIDCFIREDSILPINYFFAKHKEFYVVHRDRTNVYNPIGITREHNVSILTLTLRPSLPSYLRSSIGTKLDVKVDILYGMRDLDPPLTNVDFRCNALILDKLGYRVSKKLGGVSFFENMELLTDILGEVKAKLAIRPSIRDYRYDCNIDKRTAKMLNKGWVVMEDGCSVVKPCTCPKGKSHADSCYMSDVCSICLSDLDKDSFQRDCCNISYHSTCYLRMRSETASTCPGCRANMPHVFGRN